MQLRSAAGAGAGGAAAGPVPGLLATGASIVRGEGAGALWRGLPPAVLRGLLYGGLRLGLYSPTRDWLEAARAGAGPATAGAGVAAAAAAAALSADDAAAAGQQQRRAPSAGTKVLAGALSGGAAAAISSPTELVKVRLQAAGGGGGSAWAAARAVIAADGVAGLWRGATPGLVSGGGGRRQGRVLVAVSITSKGARGRRETCMHTKAQHKPRDGSYRSPAA